MTPDLAIELAKALEVSHDSVVTRMRELSYDWSADGLDVRGNFYYLALKDGQPTVEDFVTLLYHKVPYFCLTRKDRHKYIQSFNETQDLRHMQELVDKARKLLIRGEESKKTIGEPGEIILYLLLEAMLKAPQLCCKMALKTSQEMPVHGSDAIHVSFEPESETLTLYWGEAKLYNQLADALDEVCESIAGFLAEKEGKTPRDRDIDILKDHMNLEDGPVKKAILNYFDPYSEESNRLREVYACFVGFDFTFFNKLATMPKAEVEQAFKGAYLKRIGSACNLFGKKIREKKLHSLNFHFFLIPLPCVETLRTLYLGKLRG